MNKDLRKFREDFGQMFDDTIGSSMSGGTGGEQIFDDFKHLLIQDFNKNMRDMEEIVYSHNYRYGVEYIDKNGNHILIYTQPELPDIVVIEEMIDVVKTDPDSIQDEIDSRELDGKTKINPNKIKIINGKKYYRGIDIKKGKKENEYNILILNKSVPKIKSEGTFSKGGILNKKVSLKELFTK